MRRAPLSIVVGLAACAPAAPPAAARDAGVVDVAIEVRAEREVPVPTALVIVPRGTWDPAPLLAGTAYPTRLRDVYTSIVVHHSDFLEAPGPLAIKDYHLAVSGFADIGYHYVISPDGTIYEGRPLTRMGAHAGAVREARHHKRNDPDWGAIGVVLDGYWMDEVPPPAQRVALALLVADLQKRFPKLERVIGHREVRAGVEAKGHHVLGDVTVCPGDALFGWLDEARATLLPPRGKAPARAATKARRVATK